MFVEMINSLLPILSSYGIPVFAAILVSVFAVVALGLFMANAGIAALIFFVVIMSFVNTGISVYNKGAGVFVFPIIQFYVYGLFVAALFQNAFERRTVMKEAGKGWMLAFAALFGCHLAYGLATGVSWDLLVSRVGLINVLHTSMIAYVAASVIRDEKSLAIFTRSLLVVAVASGCYGLGRFLLFGGDPENVYASDGGMNLKITYWDFNEGLIATIAAFYCGWKLFRDWSTLSRGARTFFLAGLVVELLVILLSYRRAQQYGLVLAGLYFIWLLPKGKRAVGLLTFGLLMSAVFVLGMHRAAESLHRNNVTLMESLAPDAESPGSIVSHRSRFYELYVAFDTVRRSPLVGVGAWGEFDAGTSSTYLSYHQGNYSFVHSGLGHVLLKSGLIGLTIFCGMLLSAWKCASRARPYVRPRELALFEACRAGLIFLVPTLLVAPLIPDFRAMALLGVILAVPIGIASVARSPSAQLGASRTVMTPAMRPFIHWTLSRRT